MKQTGRQVSEIAWPVMPAGATKQDHRYADINRNIQ